MTGPFTIGLLHPGEMGTAVGRSLVAGGHQVLWASEGRSEQTAGRARAAGFIDTGTARAIAERAAVIISVCPPHSAVDVACSVAGFRGLFVDANAVSPQTASRVAEIVTKDGARYVDGGIIGPPSPLPGSTRLYLSGAAADEVRALFGGTAVDARIAGAGPWSASALKMAYAGWTKGSAALLLAVRELADAESVRDALDTEWELSLPGVDAQLRLAEQSAARKGWRWTAEMTEIAATMGATGLPEGFHAAAAEIFSRFPRGTPAQN